VVEDKFKILLKEIKTLRSYNISLEGGSKTTNTQQKARVGFAVLLLFNFKK
jgi:hypothetical protein